MPFWLVMVLGGLVILGDVAWAIQDILSDSREPSWGWVVAILVVGIVLLVVGLVLHLLDSAAEDLAEEAVEGGARFLKWLR